MPALPVRCAVCGEARTHRLYTKSGYDIARCVRCGLVFASPRAPLEAITARYTADYFWREYLPALGVSEGKFEIQEFDRRYAPLLELIAEAPGRRLLEIGSGAGFFLKAAERRGWSVRGVELSEDASSFARDVLDLDVSRASAETLALEPGSYDAVALLDTIEHLLDPRRVLTAVARALVPGGLLLVATPNFRALSRHIHGASWAVLSPLEHLYYFEESTLGALLESCGFGDVRFVRRHVHWTPQETMNFLYTHDPRSRRWRIAGWIGRLGGYPLARAIQFIGRQDILLCVARK